MKKGSTTPKWRAKVTAIEESKDLTSLSLDELIGNLKVYEMIIKKDSEIVKAKVERKSLALKSKKESSDEECSTSGSEDEEYAMAKRDDDKTGKNDRKCFRCGDPNHLIGECPKPPKDKNQRAFVGGSWSDSGDKDDEKVKDETCLVTHASSEVCSESSYFSDENTSIDDITLDNEYDKLYEEEAIREIEKKILENNVEDETLEIDEVVNIKESRNHPLENVIGNLNQRTLRSQAQNQSNFYCFISTIEPKNVNEALGDESWIVVMQEELNQFIANDVWELVPQPTKNMNVIGTKWCYNKVRRDNVLFLEIRQISCSRLQPTRGHRFKMKLMLRLLDLSRLEYYIAYACP
ncbi:retrovirus-related pol polyprotein from transposon TNT 1-94 [Tanacetum coccineum]